MSPFDAAFAGTYQALVATLFRDLRPADRVPEAELLAAEARLGHPIPPPLRAVYALSGRFDELHHVFNDLVPPDDLVIENGGMVFYTENQCVVEWGVLQNDLGEADPPAYQAPPDQPAAWVLESASLAAFLEMMVYVQAALGGLPWSATVEVDAQAEARIAAAFPLVSDGGGPESGMRLYAEGPRVLMVLSGDTPTLFAAAKTRKALREMRRALHMEWEEIG